MAYMHVVQLDKYFTYVQTLIDVHVDHPYIEHIHVLITYDPYVVNYIYNTTMT